MSGQPSASESRNAQPDPNVSGKSLPPLDPLLWRKLMPALAVTSTSRKPGDGRAGCASRGRSAVALPYIAVSRKRRRFTSFQGDEPVLHRIDDQLGGLVNTQRVHDVRAMDGNGVDAQPELRGNLLVRLA